MTPASPSTVVYLAHCTDMRHNASSPHPTQTHALSSTLPLCAPSARLSAYSDVDPMKQRHNVASVEDEKKSSHC